SQGGTLAPTLATTAPSEIAGQSERPHRISAASARPVGGQTVVTCSATSATRKPSLAATTYATATARPIAMRRRTSELAWRTNIGFAPAEPRNGPPDAVDHIVTATAWRV